MQHQVPREGWIIAGDLDGSPIIDLMTDVAGVPHLVRIAMELAMAGITDVVLIAAPHNELAVAACTSFAPFSARAKIRCSDAAPVGEPRDPVVIVRADRVFHRDLPKSVVQAWRHRANPETDFAQIRGDDFDAVLATRRAQASNFVSDAKNWSARATALRSEATALVVEPPYLGFVVPLRTSADLRRAERTLVWSLRKSADGIAAKAFNRWVSLPLTFLLRRTGVLPNHVTVLAFISALVGGIIIGARPTYLAGVVGMLLVEWGSIIDGIDGELARLKYLFSTLGQWMDTLADDFANVAYISGITIHLHAVGVQWAAPLGIAALIAFALTQSTQYWLITKVYHSGDLAAIPWAFQSSEFLSQRPKGIVAWAKATAPKLLKRDFAVSAFLVFAIVGHLEWILVVFSTGALVFFVVFLTQFVRNVGAVREQMKKR
jgi:phosphatidylglycerophosphate synthase